MQNADRSYSERIRRIKGKIYSSGTQYIPLTRSGAENMLVRIESQSPFFVQESAGTVVAESCCGTAPPPPSVAATVYTANGTADGLEFRGLEGSNTTDAYVVKYSNAGVAQWAARILGVGGTDALTTSADGMGNCYVAGIYRTSSISIYSDDGTLFSTLVGELNDIFLAKFNNAGTAQWATRITGIDKVTGLSNEQVNVVDIACTTAGDVFMSGVFRGTQLTVYNSNGTSADSLTNNAKSNGYLLKYNTEGNLQWKVGLTLSDSFKNTSCEGIVVYQSSVYITGAYSANLTFGSTGAPLAPLVKDGAAPSNGFIVKYSTSGVPAWAARIAGNSPMNSESGIAITSDSNGDMYVGGYYTGSVTVYSTPSVPTSITLLSALNSSCMFLAKYNSSGVVQWATHMDTFAPPVPIPSIPRSILNGLSVVGTKVYATGAFLGPTLTIYSANPIFIPIIKATTNAVDSFVASFDTGNGNYSWCNLLTKTGSELPNVNFGYGIAGTVAVGSYLSSPLALEQTSGGTVPLTNSGTSDAYIVKYSNGGLVDWRARVAGTSAEAATAVAQTADGVYVTGLYNVVAGLMYGMFS